MKNDGTDKDVPGQSEDSTGILKRSLLEILAYSLFALGILVLGRFFWSLGFVLFILFAIAVLSRLPLIGLLFLIEGLVLRLVARVIQARGLQPSRFDEMSRRATDLLRLNVIMVFVEVYLISISVLLGISFFW